MNWQETNGSGVLIPSQPRGIIHFLGGAFVATAPQITYRYLLEQLALQGYAIVATPFVNTLDHTAIARDVLSRFETIYSRLQATNTTLSGYLPIYGMGHSMGCKLHLLIGSIFKVQRAGNVLVSFNNYEASQAIPLVQQLELSSSFNIEFTPSPVETNGLIANNYQVRRNLLIRFTNDTIDQTPLLKELLEPRFPSMTSELTLPGNHLTPLNQDVINWQPGEIFTPFDVIGQWFKQNFSRDSTRLLQEICRWLDPRLST
jgi:hypothetical protein